MLSLLKRPLHVLSNRLRRDLQPAERMKEKWIADFSKPEKSCFDIKPEISHNAYLDNGSLFLGLKKNNCMAWLETADRMYVDQLIEAHFRFEGQGGYCAAGIMFRLAQGGTCYLALFSNKGYFRVDAVSKNVPSPLVGWTEAPGFDGNSAAIGIIARGDHLIFLLNGKWIAETQDSSITGGHLGFALVSYNEAASETLESSASEEDYVCRAWLDFLSVDSRPAAVDEEYNKWCGGAGISAESRLRLAESYAALERFGPAYDQVLKAWQQREAAARSVTATYSEMRTRSELLFAARMAVRLGQYRDAEEYIDTCLAMEDDSPYDGGDGLDALSQKAIILSAQDKYAELAGFLPGYIQRVTTGGDPKTLPPLYGLLGYAFWNLQDYAAAAVAWKEAFSRNEDGGLYAASAADAFEMLGNNAQALRLRIDAGNCFLRQGDTSEMEALMPKLLAVGTKSWEAHALAAQWVAAIGDVNQAEAEQTLADELQQTAQPKPQPKAETETEAKAAEPEEQPQETAKASTKTVKKRKAPAEKSAAKESAEKTAEKTVVKKTAVKKTAPKTKPKPDAAAAKKTSAKPDAPKKTTAKKAPVKKETDKKRR
jgi:tetratricopeptide (TPR) repeat protein